jgi:hypothetical protein
VTDTAAQRLLDRLLAAPWNDLDAEQLHTMSRGRLANEFFRRVAVWGDFLKIEEGWPFLKLAAAFDPSVPDASDWLERVQRGTGRGFGGATRHVLVDMFQWATLGEQPAQRFPQLEDPYEPLTRFFERGGELITMHGSVELMGATLRFRPRAERAAQAPFAIDLESLEALDRDEQLRINEERRARRAKQDN